MDYTELLPPLPEREFIAIGGPPMIQFGPYEADEMRAYALSAIAAAAPAIRRAERERIIAECVPGGSYCDPQQVADAIRALPDEAHNVGAKAPT